MGSFPAILSTTTAIAPSPVTLQAVPKLSIAIYKAIISACKVSSNPSILSNTPRAAIIAPPGTPGAATIVIPSIIINPLKSANRIGCPLMYRIAIAQAVIFIVLPAKWMVAQSGTVKMAMLSRTPFLMVCANVTGMVAAVMVNVGAARAAQGVPATILYYNDILEHETGLPSADYGRSMGVCVGMSFFSHSIYGGGGPGLFHGNHVVTRHSKGVLIPAVTAANCLDGGTQTFSAEATSGLFKEVFGGLDEFRTPIQVVGKEAKKIAKKL